MMDKRKDEKLGLMLMKNDLIFLKKILQSKKKKLTLDIYIKRRKKHSAAKFIAFESTQIVNRHYK